MNILITGVTKGIGYFLAKEFLKRGDKVFGVGRTFESLKEIEKEYKNFIPLNYDVSNIENIDKIFKEIESENENIDILINNAGIGFLGEFEKISWEDNKKIIDLNINSLVYLTHRYINHKKIKGGIINISSTGAFQVGGPYFSIYYASKSFVSSFTNGLSEELRGKNFRVMGVYPGPTKTNFVGMKESENFYIMNAKDVATIIVKDYFNGKEICIPGFFNKFLVYFGKIIPRSLELKILKKIQLKKL